jgi:tryptophan halogenase
MKKIVIVGGGAAGWMTASYLATFHKDLDITVIESPAIPTIQVGESVTPHVSAFFRELDIPTYEWMEGTAAVYKLGNKFVNWSHGQGEAEYFSFTYSAPEDYYFKDISQPQQISDFRPRRKNSVSRSIDHLAEMYKNKDISRVDQYAHSQYHYMSKNTAFIRNGQNLLNQPWGITHHINAEMTGNFLRDRTALPLGVKHIQAKVTDIKFTDSTIHELVLETGEVVTGDIFVDASGFHKLLVKALDWEHVYYDYPIDSAWVGQTNYKDQPNEMKNHTESIAEPSGWRFRIGLYHRMGNGYCFSSKHISDEDALAHFKSQLTNDIRLGPKLIKWRPSRLKDFAKGNVMSIGLSSGFIEPMEANALYITVVSIRSLSDLIKRNSTDWTKHNELMSWSFDDVYEFLLTHYTLTQREDTPFWKDMKEWGQRLGHSQLALGKASDPKNSVFNGLAGRTLFPDYMWMQLASAWGHHDNRTLDPAIHELAKHTILSSEKKHDLVSNMMPNNYVWHKENVYNGLEPIEWENKHANKSK